MVLKLQTKLEIWIQQSLLCLYQTNTKKQQILLKVLKWELTTMCANHSQWTKFFAELMLYLVELLAIVQKIIFLKLETSILLISTVIYFHLKEMIKINQKIFA